MILVHRAISKPEQSLNDLRVGNLLWYFNRSKYTWYVTGLFSLIPYVFSHTIDQRPTSKNLLTRRSIIYTRTHVSLTHSLSFIAMSKHFNLFARVSILGVTWVTYYSRINTCVEFDKVDDSLRSLLVLYCNK